MDIIFSAKFTDQNCTAPLSETMRHYFTIQLKSVYDRFAAELVLSDLKSIVIPENFQESVLTFQKEKGLPDESMKNEILGVYAIVISYPENNRLVRTLFIHKSFVYFLIDDENLKEMEDPNRSQYNKALAVNMIHHQLAYVHEYTITDHIRDNHTEIANHDYLWQFLLRKAEAVFNEYFVSRLSSSTHWLSNEEIEYVVKQVRYISGYAPIVIHEFELSGNVDRFVAKMQEMISMLLKYSASILGNAYSIDNLKDMDYMLTKVEAELDGTFFAAIWSDLEFQLNHLYDTFNGWTSFQPLVSLGKTILLCWNNLGISLKTVEQGIYYAIL